MNKELILPGIMKFPAALEVPDGLIEQLIAAKAKTEQKAPVGGPERFSADGPNLFKDFPECAKYMDYVQSVWKEALCHFIDQYDEVVYDIFWEEGAQLICYGPGKDLGFHSDTKAEADDEGVSMTLPHKRYLTCIAYLNDDYIGGELEFKYWDLQIKPGAGDIYIYPSNFLYAHRSRPLLTGKKLALLVSFCTGRIEQGELGRYLT